MMKDRFVARIILLSVLALAGTSFAQQTKILESGETTVQLSSQFLGALKSLGVSAGLVSPTQLHGSTVNFPINGGAIDLNTAAGNIGHTGGLTLEAGGVTVAIENFVIDTTGTKPVITGLVVANGKLLGRIRLFDLALPTGFALPIRQTGSVLINWGGVSVTLDPAAAQALNGAFNTGAFHSGFAIGTARVRAFTNGWIPYI